MTVGDISETVSGNLLSHYCVATLSLLLSVLFPLCVKLIFTCLQASRNKRCHLQSPRTLICLVLLSPPPRGSRSPGPVAGPAVLPAAGRCPRQPQPALPHCPSCSRTSAAMNSPHGKPTAQTAAFFCFVSFLPQVLCPRSRTQREITCSEVLCSKLCTGDSPCLLL